jgi:hypothetical protein
MDYATNGISVVVNAMLGGELQYLSDIDSTKRWCKSS